LFGRRRLRVFRARRLDRPADRLKRFPAALRRKRREPELLSHPVGDLAARPQAAIRRRLLEPNLQLRQKIGLEHRGAHSVVAAKIAKRLRPECVIAGQKFLDPARHKTRQCGNFRHRMALCQKPDRLVMPPRARIRTLPVALRQFLDAQMIRYMRHGSPPALHAYQIYLLRTFEGIPSESISRKPYQHAGSTKIANRMAIYSPPEPSPKVIN